MKRDITIVSTCRMGAGTFEAKFIPLSKLEHVKTIVVVRKEPGPVIPKVTYCVLPKICKQPLLNMLIAPFVIAHQVRKRKADLILAYHYVPHFYLAYISSLITGIPYILGQTGSDEQKLALRPIMGALLRLVIKKAAFLNVPGTKSARFWDSLGIGEVKVLHSSIDTEYFIPAKSQQEFDFIYIGRLEDYKGVHRIIEAMRNLALVHKTASLAIVGYGSQEQQLKSMVSDLGLSSNVSFHGFQKDTRSWLWRARVFVMASEIEGLPCALMEAMSCGMVCISSLVGNISDIIEDGISGYGFVSDDVERLLQLMLSTFAGDDQQKVIRKKAREIIREEHSYYSTMASWEKELSVIVG